MQYKLTDDEKSELAGRQKVIAYLQALVESDIQQYVRDVVLPRLKIAANTPVKVSVEFGTVQVINSQEESE